MREKPILFSVPMIRAILAGGKTMTRRVVKPQPDFGMFQCDPPNDDWWMTHGPLYGREPEAVDGEKDVRCPYGKPGDRLWVRETWAANAFLNNRRPSELQGETIYYRATYDNDSHFVWRPSIHMPRWASRLTLEITDIRVERIQDISHEDALAEGCTGYNWVASSPYISGPHTDDGELPVEEYERLWESLHGSGSWAKNEWVWVISFKRIDPRRN